MVATSEKLKKYFETIELETENALKIANTARQPVSVELNEQGEIKTMSDGTKYQVTPSGWKKI